MPNWCNNAVVISHPDQSKLEALAAATREGKFCEFICPVPQELVETVAGSKPEGPERDAHEAQQKANLEKYGYAHWYDFCVNEWGTKWGVEPYEPEDAVVKDGKLEFGFDSAWAPPLGIYERLVEQGFDVKGYYFESGMGFCGRWEDGDDDYYEIGGMKSAEVAETIPKDLDEMMNISEDMAQWEDENEECDE